MEINDECGCGARFAVAGSWADCASVHRDWLSSHKACRQSTDRLAKLEDGIRALAKEYGNASAEMTALGDHETAELWSETHNRLRALLDE